jgi:transcription antitermination factor NusG
MTAFWFVLQSKPRKEEFLCGQLASHRLEFYCPRIPVRTVNPRARKMMPYFPGYVFVHVDLEQVQLSSLRWMPGALGVVSVDREPAYVPESLLAAIRTRVSDFNRFSGNAGPARFQAGADVLIQYGPFAGYKAIFDAGLPGSERVRVLLSLLRGRQIRMELPSNFIELPAQR